MSACSYLEQELMISRGSADMSGGHDEWVTHARTARPPVVRAPIVAPRVPYWWTHASMAHVARVSLFAGRTGAPDMLSFLKLDVEFYNRCCLHFEFFEIERDLISRDLAKSR